MIAAVIREATTDEALAAAEVFLAARHAMEDIVPMVHGDDETRAWMRDIVFREDTVTIALMDGRLAAMMATSPGWIDHLYVHPDFHNRGLGTALVQTARHSPHAAAGLQLWTFQANTGARRFYARHGFKEVELTDGQGNEEKTPDVRLEWRP
ncbi:MAG: GNAT family N-acetyltransferase [Micropepsaceae bacterium]